jgi:hypothetical protein
MYWLSFVFLEIERHSDSHELENKTKIFTIKYCLNMLCYLCSILCRLPRSLFAGSLPASQGVDSQTGCEWDYILCAENYRPTVQIIYKTKIEKHLENPRRKNKWFYFFSCGPKSYFTLFCNLIGYASGPYEPVRTARDLKP